MGQRGIDRRLGLTTTSAVPDLPIPVGVPLRLFAGRPDAIDPSHLTIRYEAGAAAGTIDGYLQDDDTVRLVVRDGPASRPLE